MESIDVLGERPERHRAFTGALLAEAEDEVLQSIVQDAARALGMPIALINFVLEEIQFFKAHYGLPPDLAAARGTERNVSFCQFVVRHGEPFEVTDAEQDERVPQHLVKHYGIKSYLGIPVLANDVIVGSLCVIGTQPREFTEIERQNLKKMAELVNVRLALLSTSDAQMRSSLVGQAATPALTELRRALGPIRAEAEAGRITLTAIASFLRLVEHAAFNGLTPRAHLQRTLAAARQALERCENSFYEIEAEAGDAEDARLALEHVLTQSTSTRLSDIAISGRELARPHVMPIGGVFLPDFVEDPVVATPRPLGVALVATCLANVAARMAARDLSGGMRIEALALNSLGGIGIRAAGLPAADLEEVASELSRHTGEAPSVAVRAVDGELRLLFAVVQPATDLHA